MRILPRGAAVVRGEEHVGVVGEVQFVEHIEDAADRLIEIVDHGSVPVGGVHLARRAGLVSGQRGRFGLGREGGWRNATPAERTGHSSVTGAG